MRPIVIWVAAVTVAVATLAAAPQTERLMPIDEVRVGMVGVGRTVFAGEELEEFTATVLGVLRNINGPRRDLILARLAGGPLANTGVIQGMSGSPVYIDGRLVGAVSYSLGSFSKEPLAGITPIEEMTADVRSSAPRVNGAGLAIAWPATQDQVFAALANVARRALSPLGDLDRDLRVVGPQSLADLAPTLRPIGAAVVTRGFEPAVERDLRHAFDDASVPSAAQSSSAAGGTAAGPATLRPGDPVGMSLMRGDMDLGATGTVTYVDGNRVYAFGHPFLNLGPATLAMTSAHVYTVLPSLSSSMKIATMGPVIGTITQDRATAVGGLLGAGPPEMQVDLSIASAGQPSRRFSFSVLHDASLTPLFSYVAVLNAISAYERQLGVTSIHAKGTVEFTTGDRVSIDDVFSGDGAVTAAAGALTAPIGTAVANPFREVMPSRLTVSLETAEAERSTTIERAWLDTTRPELGGTYSLQVQVQDYRGARRVLSIPVQMPTQVSGKATLLVSDATTLTALEQRELDPGRATSWSEVLTRMSRTNRNNTIYVRLLTASPGTVVGGETLPALPASVQSVFGADSSVSRAPVSRTVVGRWEQRTDMAVSGSRELTLTFRSKP